MRKWAKESHLIIGNHERFAQDFARNMPQMQELVSIRTLLDTEGMDIEVTDIKQTLDFGYARFIHGDVRIWGGVGGSKLDRVAANYGQNTIMGNIHYPAIRSGCYSVPMSGLLNQEYNEADASQWMLVVLNEHTMINGEQYYPRDCTSWKVPPHRLSISIHFDS